MSEHERIRVDLLTVREGDWPPSEAEWLWARRLVDDRFFIDNIPIYARGISWGDIVLAKSKDGEFHLEKVIKQGGHSTYRVIVLKGMSLTAGPAQKSWGPLAAMGCTFEGLQGGPLYAIDVPPEANIHDAYASLQIGEREGIWDFEEGNVEHKV